MVERNVEMNLLEIGELFVTARDERNVFDIFTIDTILSLITRLHILARWNRLDPQTGAAMFRRLVDEVRGTFQGINEENI